MTNLEAHNVEKKKKNPPPNRQSCHIFFSHVTNLQLSTDEQRRRRKFPCQGFFFFLVGGVEGRLKIHRMWAFMPSALGGWEIKKAGVSHAAMLSQAL